MSKARVLAERKAYIAGATAILHARRTKISEMTEYVMRKSAEALYPIPKEKRTRILKIENQNTATQHMYAACEYKVDGGRLWYRYGMGGGWKLAANETAETLRAKISLFEQPTEEVEVA